MSFDIPNYRVLESLGTGALTTVFRARCMPTGKDYAIKTIKVNTPEDMRMVELMRAEHAIGSVIDHPNFRKVYEFRQIRQRLRVRRAILFMEYIEGIPMGGKDFRRRLVDIIVLFKQVAEGLNAMHLAGFVHADLKPANILVTPDNEVKLIDFGQSAQIGESKPRVQGTRDYMAPEQSQRKPLDPRTDVFGFGATLHKILTGSAVLTEMNRTASALSPDLVGKRRDEMERGKMGDLPPAVSRLISDCTADDPSDRPADMPSLNARIDVVLAALARQAAAASAEASADDTDQAEA